MSPSWIFALLMVLPSLVDAAEPRRKTGEPASLPLNGREVYVRSCAMCHSTGAGGAPRPGRDEDWAERAKKGPAELMVSVLRGKGGMPPKGGNASLQRIEAYLALDYMLNGEK
jgi:cytochrome c5